MIVSAILLLVTGFLLGELCNALKLPRLVGMLLAGILLGSEMFDLLDSGLLAVSADIRRFALAIILIRAGLSLDLKQVSSSGRSALLLCFLPASMEILGTILFAPLFFDISITEAALLGTVLSAVSPAVVVPRMIRLAEQGYGAVPQLIMAGASLDDIFVVMVFSALMTFSGVPSSSGFYGITLLLFFGTIILKRYKPKAAAQCKNAFQRIWRVAEVFLFVLVGAEIKLQYAVSSVNLALPLLMICLIFRMLGVLLCMVKSKLSWRERLFCIISYLPKATVQASIGGLPLAAGLAAGDLILTVAVLSILITAPIGAALIDKTAPRLLTQQSKY